MSELHLRNDREGPVGSLLARWWLGVILLVVGAAAGIVAALPKAPQYTAETRLVVGSQDLASYQVPGFAQAAQELASNYSRYVDDSSVVSADLSKALGSDVDSLVSVSASPIPSSDVISVQVVAKSPAAARKGATAVARTLTRLTASSTSGQAPALLQGYTNLESQYQAASDNVGEIQGKIADARSAKRSTSSLKQQLSEAQLKAATLRLQASAAGNRYQNAVTDPPSQSQLNVIQPAALIANNKNKTREIYAVGGAIVGLLIALVVASFLERRKRRRPGRRRQVSRPSTSTNEELASFHTDPYGDSMTQPIPR